MLRKIGECYVDPERVTHLIQGASHGEPITRICMSSGAWVDVEGRTIDGVATEINDVLRGARGRR